MKWLYSFIVIVCLGSTALAASPVPEDFALGLIVEAPGAEAIYKITVPDDVYRHICRADLGDMRIFNARGEAVPHMLRRPVQTRTTKKEGAPPAELPFFPIYGTGETAGGGTAIHVATDEKGVVVDVKSGGGQEAADSRLSAYLIDASAIKQRPCGLQIDWTDNSTSFTVSVTVEASADLNQWETMTRNATLAELDFGGHRLSRHIIDLPAASAKYMRLLWPERARGARVVSVKALFPGEFTINQQARQWTEVAGRAIREKTTVYEYDSEAKFPVDIINIKLPEHNSLLQANIKSRSELPSSWRLQGTGMFYNLTIEGSLFENSPAPVSCISDRYWRIETDSESGIGSGIPVLRLGWIPHELLFVARGEGPFTLAYGSISMQTSGQPLDALLAALNKKPANDFVKEAIIKQKVVLGGDKSLLPPPPPLPWKKWILWAVLVAGVAILGVMAWKLFTQMNAAGDREK
jgi:hypothetical protein